MALSRTARGLNLARVEVEAGRHGAFLGAVAANVDPLRIYATGLSNGGLMSHRLACEAADLFAAVAPVAAALGVEPIASCQPVRSMSMLQFSGLTDTVVPYTGGPTSIFPAVIVIPALDSFATWADLNDCTDPPSVVDLGNGASLQTHAACSDGVQVGLYGINGTGGGFNGHVLYFNTDGIDVSRAYAGGEPRSRRRRRDDRRPPLLPALRGVRHLQDTEVVRGEGGAGGRLSAVDAP